MVYWLSELPARPRFDSSPPDDELRNCHCPSCGFWGDGETGKHEGVEYTGDTKTDGTFDI